jgi:hypothetical protein
MLLLLIIGISATYSGFELIIQPDGSSLDLSTSYLDTKYFTDFSIPGLVLLLGIGLVNLSLFIMILSRIKNYNILLVIEAIVLFAFIIVQLNIGIPYRMLHAICIAIALIFFCVGVSKFADDD